MLTDPEPAVLRWLPPPHLAHRRKCVVVKALLRKLTSREDLSLQVRILAQKQEIWFPPMGRPRDPVSALGDPRKP